MRTVSPIFPATRRRTGLSLLDAALALAVTSIAMLGLAQMTGNSSNQVRDTAAASTLQFVGLAAQNYLNDLGSQIQQCPAGTLLVIPAGPLTAGGAQPSVTMSQACQGVTLANLAQASYLPSDFVDTNAWGQHHALLVRTVAASPGTTLTGMVVTYGGAGSGPTDADLGTMAAQIGIQGGFFPKNPVGSTSAGTITGAYGGWQDQASNWSGTYASPTQQHLAYNLSFRTVPGNDYLYRGGSGPVSQFTMNTSLYMGTAATANAIANKHNIRNVSQIDVESLNNSDAASAITDTSLDTYFNGSVDIVGNSSTRLAFSTWGGGWYMNDIHAIRAFNDKDIQVNGVMSASNYVDINNSAYYMTANGVAVLNNVTTQGTVPGVSGNRGFLIDYNAQIDGSLIDLTSVSSPVFYDQSNNNYYIIPSGSTRLYSLTLGTLTATNSITDAATMNVAGAANLNGVSLNMLTANSGASFQGNISQIAGNFSTANSLSGNQITAQGAIYAQNGFATGSMTAGAGTPYTAWQGGQVIASGGIGVGSLSGITFHGSCSGTNPVTGTSYTGLVTQQAGGTGLYFCDGTSWKWINSDGAGTGSSAPSGGFQGNGTAAQFIAETNAILAAVNTIWGNYSLPYPFTNANLAQVVALLPSADTDAGQIIDPNRGIVALTTNSATNVQIAFSKDLSGTACAGLLANTSWSTDTLVQLTDYGIGTSYFQNGQPSAIQAASVCNWAGNPSGPSMQFTVVPGLQYITEAQAIVAAVNAAYPSGSGTFPYTTGITLQSMTPSVISHLPSQYVSGSNIIDPIGNTVNVESEYEYFYAIDFQGVSQAACVGLLSNTTWGYSNGIAGANLATGGYGISLPQAGYYGVGQPTSAQAASLCSSTTQDVYLGFGGNASSATGSAFAVELFTINSALNSAQCYYGSYTSSTYPYYENSCWANLYQHVSPTYVSNGSIVDPNGLPMSVAGLTPNVWVVSYSQNRPAISQAACVAFLNAAILNTTPFFYNAYPTYGYTFWSGFNLNGTIPAPSNGFLGSSANSFCASLGSPIGGFFLYND